MNATLTLVAMALAAGAGMALTGWLIKAFTATAMAALVLEGITLKRLANSAAAGLALGLLAALASPAATSWVHALVLAAAGGFAATVSVVVYAQVQLVKRDAATWFVAVDWAEKRIAAGNLSIR